MCYNGCMKIFLLLINVICSIIQPIPYVCADTSVYAQILHAGCYLYKTPIENTNYANVYFMIENTYFVELLSDYNDEFYKAKYMDIIGYVKKCI